MGRPAWVRAHGALVLCALTTYAVQMLFHDVSFTSVDNAIVFLLTGMAVGLSYGGTESRRVDCGRRADRSGFRGTENASTMQLDRPAVVAG